MKSCLSHLQYECVTSEDCCNDFECIGSFLLPESGNLTSTRLCWDNNIGSPPRTTLAPPSQNPTVNFSRKLELGEVCIQRCNDGVNIDRYWDCESHLACDQQGTSDPDLCENPFFCTKIKIGHTRIIVKTVTRSRGHDVNWTLADCSPFQKDHLAYFPNWSEIQTECMIPVYNGDDYGHFTLICYGPKSGFSPFTWYGGYVEIHGTRYCESFPSLGNSDGVLSADLYIPINTNMFELSGEQWVLYNGMPICSSGFSEYEAKLICQSLCESDESACFPDSERQWRFEDFRRFRSYAYGMNKLQCPQDAKSLGECDYEMFERCESYLGVKLTCSVGFSLDPSCTDKYCFLFYDGLPVCSAGAVGLEQKEADAVCRFLGFDSQGDAIEAEFPYSRPHSITSFECSTDAETPQDCDWLPVSDREGTILRDCLQQQSVAISCAFQPSTTPTHIPSIGPSSTTPSMPPTHSFPSQSPTTSYPSFFPTESPIFNQEFCKDSEPHWSNGVISCKDTGQDASKCDSLDPSPLNLKASQACCNCPHGGKFFFTDQIYGFKAEISGDIEFDRAYTFGFWIRVEHSSSQRLIFGVRLSSDYKQISDQTVMNCLYTLNGKLHWNLIVGWFPEGLPHIVKGSSDILTDSNFHYGYYNSIQITHDIESARIIMFLNGHLHRSNPYDVIERSQLSQRSMNFDLGHGLDYGGFYMTHYTTREREAEAISEEDHKSFPTVDVTAYTVLWISLGFTGSVILYAFCQRTNSNSDDPDYLAVISIGCALLDTLSDWQLVLELYRTDDEYWPLAAAFCIIPTLLGLLFFMRWMKTHAVPSNHERGLLEIWLRKNRAWFLGIMLLSSSNASIIKILWSNISPGFFTGWFNMPIRHYQIAELMKGKMINILFEEVPLFVIQILILNRDTDINRNTQTAVLIALGSTILGMILNTMIWVSQEWTSTEHKIKFQYVRVSNPTADLRLLQNHIQLGAQLFHKVFVYRMRKDKNDTMFRIEFAYVPREMDDLEGRIRAALEKYSDANTKVFIEVETSTGQLIDDLENLNSLISNSGTFRYNDGKFEIAFDHVDQEIMGDLANMVNAPSLDNWNRISKVGTERRLLENKKFSEEGTIREIQAPPVIDHTTPVTVDTFGNDTWTIDELIGEVDEGGEIISPQSPLDVEMVARVVC